jgi:transcriptional regulator with XRE-family HTH domain
VTAADLSEHELARQWREGRGLTRPQLSRLTGFSVESIQAYERGTNSAGDPIPASAMLRYRTACGAIHAGITFDWRSVTLG